MPHPTPDTDAVENMPRGGPDASWLSRRLQTDRLEYTDRYDVPDHTKQHVIRALDRMGSLAGNHRAAAELTLSRVEGLATPRILELGAGHGRLSEHILAAHPTAQVTVSDLDPTSVANVASSELGADDRVTTKVIDATAIGEPDDSYDIVVFANAFHHLPPSVAVRAIAEATRVGSTFLVVDLKRMPAPLLLAFPVVSLLTMPLALLATRQLAALPALMHDGFISGLRAYSPSAFTALGHAADPDMHVEFLRVGVRGPGTVAVAYSRPSGRTQ